MNTKTYASPKSRAADKVILAGLGIVTLVSLFPFYYVFILSFAGYKEFVNQTLYILPYSFDISMYLFLFSSQSIVRAAAVTIAVTVIGCSFNMFMTVTFAYGMAKKKMPGRKIIMGLVLFTMFFGGTLISYFFTIKMLKLMNSFWVMILPTGLSVWYFLIMKNYFQTIPESLEESAKIDGANDFLILLKIILPVSTPVLASIGLFYAVERWNEWWSAMLFINNAKYKPLQLILRETISSVVANIPNADARDSIMKDKPLNIPSLKAAMVIITVTPIMLAYPFIQKYFATGIMIGSIKE